MREKKIGLLGGSFDPIHFGHLNLAFELMEKRGLDEVWLIPAQVNPMKEGTPPHAMEHRLAMIQLAIQDIPQFHLNDMESRRPPPSYTIDTLRALVAEEAGHAFPHQFYLLLGEDTISTFYAWRNPEEIVELVPLLIGSRFIGSRSWGREDEHDVLSQTVRHAIQKGVTQTRLMDISSTHIRERLAQKMYCGHLVPAIVLDYIQINGLYTETTSKFGF